jgi:hypothetical protein
VLALILVLMTDGSLKIILNWTVLTMMNEFKHVVSLIKKAALFKSSIADKTGMHEEGLQSAL